MKPITTLITLIVLCSTAVAQNTGRIYFNADWKECEKSVARYYRVYTRINDSAYHIEDFYLSGAKEMDAVARNFRGQLDEIGLRTNYWENGQPSLRVDKVDGKRNGRITRWHANGLKSSEGSYVMGLEDGVWRWWTDGAAEIRTAEYRSGKPVGVWTWSHSDGALYSRVEYDDGKRISVTEYHRNGAVERQGRLDSSSGLFTDQWFDSTGARAAVESRRDGAIVEAIYYNEGGSTHNDTSRAWRQPTFEGNRSVYDFISAQVVYPEQARMNGIEGRVVISIRISAEGKLTDVGVAESIHSMLDAEALRVSRLLSDWEPGTKYGRPATYYMQLPILFRLD